MLFEEEKKRETNDDGWADATPIKEAVEKNEKELGLEEE